MDSRETVDACARLQSSLDEFEHDAISAAEAEERPDLWDQVVEVPVCDVRTILAALRSAGTGRAEAEVTIPAADYRRLIEASEGDDTIKRCEICGAWLDLEETATADDATGCPKVIYELGDASTCRSYRATVLEGCPARALPLQTTGGGDA